MNDTGISMPALEGEAKAAVDYRGGHLQIIASAGAGKTEVVAQRVASLLGSGCAPESVVAFTFTERAAASLKSRISRCVLAHPQLGQPFLDRLGAMFVGTIHSFCFDLLRRHVPTYETYDVLDDHRLTAFLTREAYDIGIPALDNNRLFSSISIFRTNLDVIENELLAPALLDEPFRTMYERYLDVLADNRFLTYGQLIANATSELRRPEVFAAVHDQLRHLVVDEYQDVNPAQEALVSRLASAPVHLCVVGDDDQSIYQWRGSDVANILEFTERYADVQTFTLAVNRRSRPHIITHANRLSANIDQRLDKQMDPLRESGAGEEVVIWAQDTPEDEAAVIAEAIRRYHDVDGYDFSDIAILVRGRVSLPALLDALRERDVPVQPGGRTNLFAQPEADLLGRTLCWLVDFKWRVGSYGWAEEEVDLPDLVARYEAVFALSSEGAKRVRTRLKAWKNSAIGGDAPANLIREFYDLLEDTGVDIWELDDPAQVNRLGTLARCSQVLVDYEAARRRSRPDRERPGEQRGARDRGEGYYRWLAIYVQNWARGAYEDFEGEEDISLDAVDITTVHQAKGLEWPIVFVPALSDRRFPSSRTGEPRQWRIADKLFNRARYEGSYNDERRLFYVAMTRARDLLSLSTFRRITKQQEPSRYLLEVVDDIPESDRLPDPPPTEDRAAADQALEISFSELAQYRDCGMAYRLRTLIGFQPPLVPELGYGKAVHHILRQVAEHTMRVGEPPTPQQLNVIFDEGFYLPAANRPAHRQMKQRARSLVDEYISKWSDDLRRVWAVERAFELHLGSATVIGRADVIIDESDGRERLAIVDYKTAGAEGEQHEFQLKVYTDAGRREGLIVDRAFVHDLASATRIAVAVGDEDIQLAEGLVADLVEGLRARRYVADPAPEKCARCDVSQMCKSRAQ